MGAFLLIAFLGPVLKAPGWVQNLSPYTHTPHLPGPAPAGHPRRAADLADRHHRDIG
ncbi:hypothetical protein ABT297_32125 [Dactylosporangium sp. NPDC000555]|uniref:hypothetical protein n=1 Tax=Dactylosporangium sp. NPDC000555 TaxID=3154260 RepID=UPI0033196FE5